MPPTRPVAAPSSSPTCTSFQSRSALTPLAPSLWLGTFSRSCSDHSRTDQSPRNAIPKNFSTTNIELQASRDGGYTWEYVSTVVSSGPPNTANGAPCVWEPFVHSINGKVLVHYSDQRDPNYGQKLAHQDSKDLINWGGYINDVTFKNYTLRPGMITMAQMGNGKWVSILFPLSPNLDTHI